MNNREGHEDHKEIAQAFARAEIKPVATITIPDTPENRQRAKEVWDFIRKIRQFQEQSAKVNHIIFRQNERDVS